MFRAKNCSRVVLHISLLLTAADLCHAQQETSVSKKLAHSDIQAAHALIDAYQSNRIQLQRYCAALRVEQSREDFTPKGASFSLQNWFIHCADPKNEWYRHTDEITSVAMTNDGVAVSDSSITRSMVFRDDQLVQIHLDPKVGGSVIGRNSSLDEIDQIQKMSYFDPWDIPISGSECFAPRKVVKPIQLKFLDIEKLESVKSEARVTILGFKVMEDVSILITFDSRVGKMPTQMSLVSRETGYSGVMRLAKTKWKFVQRTWLPIEAVLVDYSGNPSMPTMKHTNHVFTSWQIGPEIPDDVFSLDPNNFVRHRALKTNLIEFATVSTDSE